jgi:hypothetical protein
VSARTFRVIAAVYLVKALLVGLVWMSAPELPERAWQRVRQAFGSGGPSAAEGREVAP